MNVAKFQFAISFTVLRPKASIKEAVLPLPGGGVEGRVRFRRLAIRLAVPAKKKGIFVPSKPVLKSLTVITLKIPEVTHPIDPKTLTRGNCSEGVCVIAIELVRLHVGI